MKLRYAIRSRYRSALEWVRPAVWRTGYRAVRWRRRITAAHAAAVAHPFQGGETEALPAVEVAGILVFAYLDPHCKALRVSVDLDTVDAWLLNAAECVPMLITVNGDDVFAADYPERRPDPHPNVSKVLSALLPA